MTMTLMTTTTMTTTLRRRLSYYIVSTGETDTTDTTTTTTTYDLDGGDGGDGDGENYNEYNYDANNYYDNVYVNNNDGDQAYQNYMDEGVTESQTTTTTTTEAAATTPSIPVGQVVGFALLAVCFGIVAYSTRRLTSSRPEFQSQQSHRRRRRLVPYYRSFPTKLVTWLSRLASIHFMLPSISWLLCIECIMIVIDSILLRLSSSSTTTTTVRQVVAIILYLLESFVAPFLFLSTFHVTFLAYRTREMPFCCVYRKMTSPIPPSTSTTMMTTSNSNSNNENNNRQKNGNSSTTGMMVVDDDEDGVRYHNASDGVIVAAADAHQQQKKNVDRSSSNSEQPPTSSSSTLSDSTLVKPRALVVGMHILALVMIIINILINVDVVFHQDTTNGDGSGSDLAGRTGWISVLTGNVISDSAGTSTSSSSSSSSSSDHVIAMIHVILGLLPMAVTCCFCTYFAILLWRYGNDFSMTIYSSGCCNPWMVPTIGVTAMAVGQFFGPALFPLMSNVGILCYLLSMLVVLREIRRDMEQAVDDLGAFLYAIWGGEPSTKDTDDGTNDKQMHNVTANSSKTAVPA